MTAGEINALPERVRRYIHGVETMCDPQFYIQEHYRLSDENEALQLMYRKAADELAALKKGERIVRKSLLAVALIAVVLGGCLKPARAADVTYDPGAAARQQRYNFELKRTVGCMRASAANALRMGERDSETIAYRISNVCGGPMRAFLVGEAGVPKDRAQAYTDRLGRGVLRLVPGVSIAQ